MAQGCPCQGFICAAANMARVGSPRLLGLVMGVALVFFIGSTLEAAFVTPPRTQVLPSFAVASALAAAAPAFAQEEAAKAPEGLLNFGKIPLGGGFAINLDIPETGIVNIAVLIAGLVYLLGPILSESMSSREKEINEDIEDAIAKFNEATERLAEAQKAKAQADEVTAEILASIETDKADFEKNITEQTKVTLERQARVAENTLKEMQVIADSRVVTYIKEEAINRGL